jgi:hypothetical protein
LLGGVLHAVSKRDGLESLWQAANQVRLSWVGVAILAQLCAVCAGVARWQLLLRTRDTKTPTGWLLRTYLEGRFVGVFTPSTAGLDVYRAFRVYQLTGDRESATRPVLAEKLFGFLGLGLIAVPCLVLSAPVQNRALFLGVLCAIVIMSGGVLALLRRPKILTRMTAWGPAWMAPLWAKIGPLVTQEDLDARSCAVATVLSAISHAFTACVFVASAHALGVDVPSLSLFGAGVVVVLATLLPISIGGVGIREGVAVLLLGTCGVAPAQAALVGLLAFLATQPPAILGGVYSLLDPYTDLDRPRRSVAV